jgi:hypothetical protein
LTSVITTVSGGRYLERFEILSPVIIWEILPLLKISVDFMEFMIYLFFKNNEINPDTITSVLDRHKISIGFIK